MADVVTTKTVYEGTHRVYAQTSIRYVDGASFPVTLIDKSALTGPNGSAPGTLRVMEIRSSVSGAGSVDVAFDHTTDDVIATLNGTDYIDYRDHGGFKDPESAGGTGDIVINAGGGLAANDVVDITVYVRPKD